MLIQELGGGNVIPSTVHDKVKKQNNDGQASQELQIFRFESISASTSNFSIENKLGEGTFGPVYKVSFFFLSLSLSHPIRSINTLVLELSQRNLD